MDAPHPAPGAGALVAPLDALPFPALAADSDGRLLASNAAAAELFGARPCHDGARLQHLAPAGPALAALARRVAAGEGPLRVAAAPGVLADGRTASLELGAAPLDGARVLLTVHTALGPDAGAPPADMLSAAAGLGRTLAHEIKNPLAGIRGAAQLLRDDAEGAAADLLQVIMDETDRIRRLVDQVEAFSDERPTQRGRVNLHRVLNRVRTLTESAAGRPMRVRERYDPSLPHALGDEDQLVQVFLNLARNAADAAAERGDEGEVVFATAYRHGARARVAAAPGWRAAPLEVRVEDNGPGVDPGVQARLFSPFVTTKALGSGLGLTVVAKLVAAHEGVVDFQSAPGRTVFRVLLPSGPAA